MGRIPAVLVVWLIAGAIGAGDARALELPEGFSAVEQVTGLDGPAAVAYAPDGRLFITEKAGRVRVVDADGRLQPDPLIDISDHVNSYWDHGLLGLAVDADFATNGFVYLLYVYEDNALNPTGPKTSRLTRIKVTSDNRPEHPEAPETVLVGSVSQAPCPAPADTLDCIPADGSSHSIGSVRADPDGTLWFGSGDGAAWDVVDPTALRTYDERTFAGKIMHVGRDGRGLPGHPFCPDVSDLTKVCTKLYAKGLRNPYRFQLRPSAGPLIGDVGWGGFEEIDLAQPGGNYGWPCYEGAGRTPGYEDLAGCAPQYAAGAAAHQLPAYAYPHDGGSRAIVAGPRYEAAGFPAAYRNAWFFGDYSTGEVWTTTIDDHGVASEPLPFASGVEGLVDIESAPNGDLVYVSFGEDTGTGSVQRIVYGNRPPVARASAAPAQGKAPLAVTLSAAGSADPDGEALTYEWDLESDGSVDATGALVSHTYAKGVHHATLTVRDPRGLAASATAEVLVDETRPTASLLAPAAGSRYLIGQPIALRGAGADAEDGTLGDAALHWRITLHHGDHTHLIDGDRRGRAIFFTPPDDHDADSFLEFGLTARDSTGLEASTSLSMHPETIALGLESSPSGAELSYAGVRVTAPVRRTAAIGFHTTVSAPAELESGGRRLVFARWSDGGARLHDLVIPDRDFTLTAYYEPPPSAGPAPGLVPASPALPVPSPGPRRAVAPRVVIDTSAGVRSLQRLRGRVVGARTPLRVDVALRLRRGAKGCRWWRRPLGRLSLRANSCARPVWMRADVDRKGRWALDLRGRPRGAAYTILARARTAGAHPRVLARAISGVRIP